MSVLKSQSKELEWVKPTKTRKGYWRRRPYDRDMPGVNKRRVRALFGKLAHDNLDIFGTAEVTGKDGKVKVVPINAKDIQDNMKGVRVGTPKPKIVVTDYVAVDLAKIREIAESLKEIKQLGT